MKTNQLRKSMPIPTSWLMRTVRRRDLNLMRILLSAGADPTARSNKVICEAARLGNVPMLDLFHSFGVPLTGANVPRLKSFGSFSLLWPDANRSALVTAVTNNRVAAVKYLLGLPEMTAAELDMACSVSRWNRANWHLLLLLLEAGRKLDETDLVNAAARANSVKCLHALQRHGYELAPLADKIIYWATFYNSGQVLKYALENWAINKTLVDGCLTIAPYMASDSIFKMLAKHGTQSPTIFLELFHTLVQERIHKTAILLLPYLRFEDLPDTDIHSIISFSPRQFVTHYLQRGLPLARILLTPELAKKFIRNVPPQTLLLPQNGGQLSAQTISERLRFGRHVVSEAATLSPQCQSRAALWLAKLMLVNNELNLAGTAG
jgi:hypothetical protein